MASTWTRWSAPVQMADDDEFHDRRDRHWSPPSTATATAKANALLASYARGDAGAGHVERAGRGLVVSMMPEHEREPGGDRKSQPVSPWCPGR